MITPNKPPKSATHATSVLRRVTRLERPAVIDRDVAELDALIIA